MALSHSIRVCNLVHILFCKRIIHLILLIFWLIVFFTSVLSFFNKIHGHLSMIVAHPKLRYVIFISDKNFIRVSHHDRQMLPFSWCEILPFRQRPPFQIVSSVQNKGNEVLNDFSLFVMDAPCVLFVR